ncbi:MAG: hypothetical protein AAF321_04885 [Pseudomonadota bacterium]
MLSGSVPSALLRSALLALPMLTAQAMAAELPLTGSLRDAESCEAVLAIARADAVAVEGSEAADQDTLSQEDRERLGDAVQSGVLIDATRVSGPGGWSCTFPQVWEVREGDRWMAMAACDGGDDFFPAVMTLERLEAERYRLRLGDGADAVDMVPCRIEPPATQ